MPRKPLAVVRMVRVTGAEPGIAFVPWSVRPNGKTTQFRGLHCERCVVVTVEAFQERGLAVLLDLLGRAPLAATDPLLGHETRATADVFDLGMAAATAATFVSRPAGEPILGRIEIRPNKRMYLSSEVLRFTRIEPAKFVTEMDRLLPR